MLEHIKPYIKKFMLIESSRLADNKVHQMSLEVRTAKELLKLNEERQKWNDENSERLDFESFTMYRAVCVYFGGDVTTYQISLEDIKTLANEEQPV